MKKRDLCSLCGLSCPTYGIKDEKPLSKGWICRNATFFGQIMQHFDQKELCINHVKPIIWCLWKHEERRKDATQKMNEACAAWVQHNCFRQWQRRPKKRHRLVVKRCSTSPLQNMVTAACRNFAYTTHLCTKEGRRRVKKGGWNCRIPAWRWVVILPIFWRFLASTRPARLKDLSTAADVMRACFCDRCRRLTQK